MTTRRAVAAAVVAATLAAGCGGGAKPRPAAREARIEARDDARDAKREANTDWTKLGERIVRGKADRDVIAVGAKDGRFKKIKLAVEHSALEMFDVVVHFGNGETFSPTTRLVFGNNSHSRTIDLPGEARIIKKVVFKYGNLPRGGKAQIELWAK